MKGLTAADLEIALRGIRFPGFTPVRVRLADGRLVDVASAVDRGTEGLVLEVSGG